MKPVAIIGAGPAGLACARRLSAGGRRVILLDDNVQPGGQYFRQLPPTYGTLPRARLLRDQKRALGFLETVRHPLVEWRPRTTVWMSPGAGTLAFAGEDGSGRVETDAIVAAAGAHDRPFPVSGWTFPGVITAGGALNLAKGQGLVPGGRTVVAGNGPLLLVVATTLAAGGADVTHVVEAARRSQGVSAAPNLLWSPKLLAKGLGYWVRLKRSGADFLSGWMVARITGADRVTGVEVARVGPDGRPIGERRLLPADTVILGYGLQPSAETTRLLGCKHRFDRDLGGWVPERDDQLMTSVPGVFAAGDGAGIGGVEVAVCEGELVAEAILSRASGAWSSQGSGAEVPHPALHGPMRRLRRLDRFRRALNKAFLLPEPLAAADENTLICRCEEISLADLQNALASGCQSLSAVKAATRLGMGRCQGRNCLSSSVDLLGLADDGAGLPRARPPLRPVPIRTLLDEPLGQARPPDEADLFGTGVPHSQHL